MTQINAMISIADVNSRDYPIVAPLYFRNFTLKID